MEKEDAITQLQELCRKKNLLEQQFKVYCGLIICTILKQSELYMHNKYVTSRSVCMHVVLCWSARHRAHKI